MEVSTTRFGNLKIQPEDEVFFAGGLIGLQDCRRWILLSSAACESFAWLQSIEHPDLAFGVVSPRRYSSDYQVCATRADLDTICLQEIADARVVAILSHREEGLSVNLRAPLVINTRQNLGCQVIAAEKHALRFNLREDAQELRRTA